MTADPTTLLSLAARAEAGGDDELDADVAIALGWTRDPAPDDDPDAGDWWVNLDGFAQALPHYRSSIDAQEAVGPRIVSVMYFDAMPDYGHAANWRASANQRMPSVSAPTEPLARLAAKLRALAAGMERSDAG